MRNGGGGKSLPANQITTPTTNQTPNQRMKKMNNFFIAIPLVFWIFTIGLWAGISIERPTIANECRVVGAFMSGNAVYICNKKGETK